MAGLEGAPGAVERHLHRGEGQIGHKILATLRITVLHLGQSSQLIEARCLGSGSEPRSAAARCSPQQHVTLSLRVA
ncbi:hypothetical protein EYF80_000864 [Liparis tanakae]|uniref:Uncharacterized protein n=1 Tax=Liparis tanakae TaxID=230148 RepID=A0A4Z2JFG4_9TELE|nr:hypothetical protein EYF80_000864 [Liparis tanakae]